VGKTVIHRKRKKEFKELLTGSVSYSRTGGERRRGLQIGGEECGYHAGVVGRNFSSIRPVKSATTKRGTRSWMEVKESEKRSSEFKV